MLVRVMALTDHNRVLYILVPVAVISACVVLITFLALGSSASEPQHNCIRPTEFESTLVDLSCVAF